MMIDRCFEDIKKVVSPYFPNFETDVICVDIQNIYDSFYSEESPPHTINVKSDLPNLAPPWPLAWYEHSAIEPESKHNIGVIIGALNSNDIGSEAIKIVKNDFPHADFSDMKWFIRYFLFTEFRRINTLSFILSGYDVLTQDGRSLLGDFFVYASTALLRQHPSPDDFLVALYPTFLAISFLHCKNVTIHNQATQERLARKRIKKGKRPFFQFKTLNIQPMNEILRSEGNIEQHGLKKALHICRGHFKDYRDGRGLFGKVKGIFWWDMHLRGDEKEGIVQKDYKIDV